MKLIPIASLTALVVLSSLGCKDKGPRATSAPAAAPLTAAPAPPPGTQRLSFGPGTSSTIGFVGRKVTGQHVGNVERFAGTLDFDAAALEKSVVHVDIEMGSIKIEPDGLLKHLFSPDFFDVAVYPRATFTSTGIAAGNATPGATHTITGDLNLHGQTRSISFPAKIAVAPDAISANAEFSINRKDFKIVYPGMPDDLIRDDVTIKLVLRAPRS